MRSLLLIDDKKAQLDELAAQVKGRVGNEVRIDTWVPTEGEDPQARFEQLVAHRPTLVVTDYDLTASGLTGLFGATIVDWCQRLSIPVADYSKANQSQLPRHPDLFEIRVPREAEPAEFIGGVFNGFARISADLDANADWLKERSVAAIAARAVGKPDMESDFALYAIRIAPASGALMARVSETIGENPGPSDEELRSVLGFMAGHLLLNSVLRFPGPILSWRALSGYLGIEATDNPQVAEFLRDATYRGPFAELGPYFWLSKVDEIVDPHIPMGAEAETDGELRRLGVEQAVKRELQRHNCDRCHGANGGFYCPFTKRAVCLRPDCSTGSNSWIPQGARVCRIERDFFDEWAPVLGL